MDRRNSEMLAIRNKEGQAAIADVTLHHKCIEAFTRVRSPREEAVVGHEPTKSLDSSSVIPLIKELAAKLRTKKTQPRVSPLNWTLPRPWVRADLRTSAIPYDAGRFIAAKAKDGSGPNTDQSHYASRAPR